MTTATLEPRAPAQARPKTDRPEPPPDATPRRPFPVRRLIFLTLLLAGVGAAWWRYDRTSPVAPAELVLQGNIDVRQVNLSFKVGGRITAMLVDEGDAVKAGQPIATLDDVYFKDELQLALARRESAKANLERLSNGFRSEEIEQARAQEGERQATLKRAEQDFRRAQNLRGTGAVAVQDFEIAQASLREAEARLKSATASRKLFEAGSRAEDISAAKAQLDAEEARVVETERKLADSKLYAPNDGVVLTRSRETGAIVNPGETIFTLTLSSVVWVRTYVNERDLGTVEPGMEVAVRTDAAKGRTYTGQVGFVSPTAEFTPKTVETRELRTDLVYRLRIVVEDPDGGLRQGMPVTVSVKLPEPRQRTFKERLYEALGLDRLGLKAEAR